MELTRGQRQENDDEGKLSIGEDKRGAGYRKARVPERDRQRA